MENEEKWLDFYKFLEPEDLTEFVHKEGFKSSDIQAITVNPKGVIILYVWIN